jgi:hypothetical protein
VRGQGGELRDRRQACESSNQDALIRDRRAVPVAARSITGTALHGAGSNTGSPRGVAGGVEGGRGLLPLLSVWLGHCSSARRRPTGRGRPPWLQPQLRSTHLPDVAVIGLIEHSTTMPGTDDLQVRKGARTGEVAAVAVTKGRHPGQLDVQDAPMQASGSTWRSSARAERRPKFDLDFVLTQCYNGVTMSNKEHLTIKLGESTIPGKTASVEVAASSAGFVAPPDKEDAMDRITQAAEERAPLYPFGPPMPRPYREPGTGPLTSEPYSMPPAPPAPEKTPRWVLDAAKNRDRYRSK